MLIIEKIDSYMDGGTIAIKCRMRIPGKEVPWLEGKGSTQIEICVDKRIGNKGRCEPSLWFGYPGAAGSQRIEDEEIIDYITKKLAEHKERTTSMLDEFINIRENIRDFKIEKTLEK